MASILRATALLALLTTSATLTNAGASGSGTTTRYWDCCKPSCAWSGKASVSAPVTTCDISDNPLTDSNAASGCNGGTAYMCSDQSPWAVNDTLAYGFAATTISGGSESSWCCACYELTFTSGAVAGKKMIVQATNTGGDLSENQFDLAIPGGGVGIYNGCTAEWGAPSSGWGAQYGGISDRSSCDSFPSKLQPGCDWRFDWFEGADNPTVDFVQVTCPAALTAKTGCVRDGETPTGSSSVATDDASPATSASSSVATSASSSVASSSAVVATSSEVSSSSAAVASSAPSSVASSSVSSTVEPAATSATVASSSVVESSAVESTPATSTYAAAPATSEAASAEPSAVPDDDPDTCEF